jgi:hypothetical protein
MRRIGLAVVLALSLFAKPLLTEAQQPVWRLMAKPAYESSVTLDGRGRESEWCPQAQLSLDDVADVDCASRRFTLTALGDSPDTFSSQHVLPYRASSPQLLLGGLLAGGAVAGVLANSLLNYDHRSFWVYNKGFFTKGSKDGGADLASHFTDYYAVQREFAFVYEMLGFPENDARWISLGVSVVTQVINEIGDGFDKSQGFSREDVIMGTLGATTAALVSAAHVDDLVGFRASHVPGGTYSNDVYSADLKLAGVARRLGLDVGPARFLLFSVTYSAKGYRVTNATPADKQRLVGFEFGLNLEEMLNAVNARRDTWWGYALHVVGDNIRIPYTAVGMRYDLNHDQWHGPNNGNFP